MLTEQDELQAENDINNYIRILHEQRAEIRSLKDHLRLSNENEMFRVRESNQLANENAELRKENARVTNNCESFRILLIDVEAAFSSLFPRLTRMAEKIKPELPLSNRPPIRSVGS